MDNKKFMLWLTIAFLVVVYAVWCVMCIAYGYKVILHLVCLVLAVLALHKIGNVQI